MKAQTPTHKAALSYAKYHWSIIPMRTREKRPLIRWMQYQQRCATSSEINQWYEQWPDANVGIVTGVVSGIVVLDIDPRHGGDESLDQWIKEYGPLPLTAEVKTGGGGRHLYFKHSGGLIRNKVGIVPGIDLRGDGGCIVAPPSMHPNGKQYCWVSGHEPDQMKIAELPNWLMQILTGETQHKGQALSHWRNLVHEGIPEGDRNNTIASICGHLLWHGVDPGVVMELLLCWNRVRCHPPLDDKEVIHTVQSILKTSIAK